VPAILARTRPPVLTQTGYITMGGPDEATDYVRGFGQAWNDTPGAIAWLAEAADAAPQSTAPANGTPDRVSVQFRANGEVTPGSWPFSRHKKARLEGRASAPNWD